jgi:hypothetical protein
MPPAVNWVSRAVGSVGGRLVLILGGRLRVIFDRRDALPATVDLPLTTERLDLLGRPALISPKAAFKGLRGSIEQFWPQILGVMDDGADQHVVGFFGVEDRMRLEAEPAKPHA